MRGDPRSCQNEHVKPIDSEKVLHFLLEDVDQSNIVSAPYFKLKTFELQRGIKKFIETFCNFVV